MAVFDPAEQRMCVRVVYDGVASAGKTTNLHQLCALFATQRTTELYTPEAVDGRTLYFDWVQIAAGVVCGFPLMCQVISVPGHVVLTPRRRHLLASADAVVYVCDSSASSVDRAREGLRLLDEIGRERGTPIPLLVQANKQDQPGALAAPELLRRLGREQSASIAAIATEGIGVVDTFVHAVRIVSRAMQARSDTESLRIELRQPDRANDVLADLARTALDPEMAAEMVLEDALSAYLLADLDAASRPVDPLVAIDALDSRRADTRRPPARTAPPRLPLTDVPTGFIWPAHTGRKTLERLKAAGALATTPIVDAHGSIEHEAGTHVLRTSSAMRFADAETARQALVRAARERTQLEELVAPDTVLVAQTSADGACWIWRILPKMPTLRAWFEARAHARLRATADPEITSMLAAYGVALAVAAGASLRQDLRLDLEPRAFSVQSGRIRYTGDLAAADTEHERLPGAVMDAIDSVGELGLDDRLVLDAFERELSRRLGNDEATRVTMSLSTNGQRLRDAIDARVSDGA